MTTREEAAAKAHYESGEFSEKWEMSQPAIRQFNLARMTDGVAAADAHDAAHGIHRLELDDATVERAAVALFLEVSPRAVWDGLAEHSYIKLSYMTAARTMLAAAVEADHE